MEDMGNIEYLEFKNKIEGTGIDDLLRVLQESKLELIIKYFNEEEFQDEEKLKLFFNHILGIDISKDDLYQLINSKNGKKIKPEEYEEESENHKKNLDIVKLIMCEKRYYKVVYDEWGENRYIIETNASDRWGKMSIADDYLEKWWDTFIYNEWSKRPLKKSILTYPFLLNTPRPHTYSIYNSVISNFFSREDFPWKDFNELADKVELYSLADFFRYVPIDKKRYIADYICKKCDDDRYSFLMDKYNVEYYMSKEDMDLTEDHINLMIRILDKDKNDGSWLRRRGVNKFIRDFCYYSTVIDQVVKWGNLKQVNILATYKKDFEPDDREKLENRIDKEKHKLKAEDAERIKAEPDLKRRFEKYTRAKAYYFAKDTKPKFSIRVRLNWDNLSVEQDEGWEAKAADFRYVILYILNKNNIMNDKSFTIMNFIKKISSLINDFDDKERIAGNLKEAVKEVLKELDTIGLRVRQDGSIASIDSINKTKEEAIKKYGKCLGED